MSQDSTETIQELRDQLIQQKSQIEFQTNQLELLLQRQGVPEMSNTNEVQMSETPLIHDLPVRPSYDWTPSPELASLMPSRQQDIFLQVLDADTRKAMVEQYPSMAGVRYTPPQRLPVAARKYNKSQIREDDNLQRIQYAISAALRPLDVLAHMLLPLMAEVQSPPCSPSVELDNVVFEETSSESSSCNGSSTVLAKHGLVPSASTNEPLPTLVARPSRTRSNHIAALALAVDKSKLKAIRLGCLKRKFQRSHYFLDASDTLLSHFTANTSSNRIYARAHHLFIAWCISYGVDVCYFKTTQLVNFLVAAHRSGYSINTIQVFKSAIMQLHLDRDTIDCDTDVRTLMTSFQEVWPVTFTDQTTSEYCRHLVSLGEDPV